jgi:hypothetical protein
VATLLARTLSLSRARPCARSHSLARSPSLPLALARALSLAIWRSRSPPPLPLTGLAGAATLISVVQLAFMIAAIASDQCSAEEGEAGRRVRVEAGREGRLGAGEVEEWKLLLGLAPFGPACGLPGARARARERERAREGGGGWRWNEGERESEGAVEVQER